MRKNVWVTNFVMVLAVILIIGGILTTPVMVHAATYPLLRLGSSGQAVLQLQQGLKDIGYFADYAVTNYYSSATQEAVIRFQRDFGLLVDGMAGQETQTALYEWGIPKINPEDYGTLYFGMYNDGVRILQNALKAKGYFGGVATAYYGHVTEKAVIDFQIAHGLIIDGIAGPQTQSALFNTKPPTGSISDRDTITAKQRDDIFWLARIIEAESGGESYIGKVAAGSVIMNRVKSNEFPNSVYDVIFEYYYNIPQFSPVEDGSIYNNPSADSTRAAEESYWGAQPVGDALFFFNPWKAAGSWIINTRQYVTTIGNHAFYR